MTPSSRTHKTAVTPGPWKVYDTWATHNSPDRFWETGVVADVGRVADGKGATKDEAEANARLIAAAPDLYEALHGFWVNRRNIHTDEPFEGALERLLKLAETAITKAGGAT